MSRAETHADQRGDDPARHHDYDLADTADALLRVWEARPDEHQDEISREAYVELVLRICEIDRARSDWEDWPRVNEIYERLSTSEVRRVGMSNLVGSHVLQVIPSQSQKTADGWTSTRTSYELSSTLKEDLLAALEHGSPEELAETVDDAASDALRKRAGGVEMWWREDAKTPSYADARRGSLKLLVGFFSPGSQADADPDGQGRNGWDGKAGSEARARRRERDGKPGGDADTASNGCYTSSSETTSNRRSERSGGEKRGGRKLSNPPYTGSTTDRDLGSFYRPNRDEFKARGTRKQRRFLDERVRLPAERFLFLHLLGKSKQASYSAAGKDEWTTVPAKTLEQRMGAPYHSTCHVWRDSDLVEAYDEGFYVPPNDDVHPRAREYRIPDAVVEKWNKLGDRSKRYWLHTEEPERTHQEAPLRTDLSDENNNALPELVDRALRVLQDADHPIRTAPIKDAIERLSGRDSQEAGAQKVGLQFGLETIERQTTASEDTISYLQNAYEMTFGGRIFFKNGGPQGLMGAVKARAYDIEGLRNCDIKSCHTTGLRQVADKLQRVGIAVDLSAWKEYPGKDVIANRTGLPRSLVKVTEHAIKYGAYLPKSIAQAEAVFADTSIDPGQLQLVEAARKYAEDPDEALGKLHDVFADMRRVIKEIADALLNEYYDATNRGGYMHNACGVSFNRRDYDEGHERQTKVMAWMLQGLEAAFIHSLTILSAENDEFDVVANEHDGLIMKGEIPQEAIEVARHMSGFHRAELVEKDHADGEEIEALYGPQDGQHEPQGEDQDLTAREREQRRLARYNAKRELPNLSEEEMRRKRRPHRYTRPPCAATKRDRGLV